LKYFYTRRSGESLGAVSAGATHDLNASSDVPVLDSRTYTTNAITWGGATTYEYAF